jgi:carbamoyl-phosphate synthase / aspartate carbamoyltransferase / dihydroorotase
LPLLLTSVSEGRLTLDDVTSRLHENPRTIFNLPKQDETFIEIDLKDEYEIRASNHQSRCGWTPFEGLHVRGRIRRVFLRGKTAYEDGQVLSSPGFGRNVRSPH